MNKSAVAIVVLVLIVSVFASDAFAKQTQNNGKPFQEIWDAIYELQDSVTSCDGACDIDIDYLKSLFVSKDDYGSDVSDMQERIDELEARVALLEESLSEPEVCDYKDNDFDGFVDEGFDLLNDTDNCGSCGNVCSLGHMCISGNCVYTDYLCNNYTNVCGGLVINEFDAVISSVSLSTQFVELYAGPDGANKNIDGYVLVFFDGNSDSPVDASYYALDLVGTTDSNGLFVVGNAAVNPDIVIPDGLIRRTIDAIAIYNGSSADWVVSKSPTKDGLVDAVVHGEVLDTELLNTMFCHETYPGCLEGQLLFENEDTSVQRCPGELEALDSIAFYNTVDSDMSNWFINARAPTPGMPNLPCV